MPASLPDLREDQRNKDMLSGKADAPARDGCKGPFFRLTQYYVYINCSVYIKQKGKMLRLTQLP